MKFYFSLILVFCVTVISAQRLGTTINATDNLNTGRVAMNSNIVNLFNSNVYNILNYGGVADSDGTNGTDNAAALVAAIAASPVSGSGMVYFPSSTNGKGYRFASTVTIPKNIKLVGDGPKNMTYFSMTSTPIYAGTQLYYSDDDTPAFIFTSGDGSNQYPFMHVNDIALKCTATTPISGSAGILMTGAISGVVIEDVTIEGFYINIDIVAAYRTHINRALLLAPIQYGIRWKNTTAGDIGWLRMENTDIVSRPTPSQHAFAAAYMQGGGAVWVENVDVNAQATLDTTTYFRNGIYSDFSDHQTSEIKVNNCNITNYLSRGVWIKATVNSPSQIQVVNSQFAPQAAVTYSAIEITGASGHLIQGVVVANNTGQNTPISSYPFIKLDWVNGATIAHNTYRVGNWASDYSISNSTTVDLAPRFGVPVSGAATGANNKVPVYIQGVGTKYIQLYDN